MEIKNLLTLLKNQKEEAPETFFAVEITEDTVKSAVWTVLDGHTKVVKIGLSKSWDGQSKDNLLTAVDQSISNASENLPKEPNGVVFGLPETWLEGTGLNPSKKLYLKTICEDLELKPLGFVVTDNAVIKYLKIEEGTPPSAIFIQLNSTELNLSLVKLGKIVGAQLVGRSGDLGPDVEEGLSRFEKIDTLPSRMILYDGQSDFEEDKQQLMSYDWEEKLPFIHFPKVESLPPDASIKAVALAGGSEVAKSLGFTIKPHKTPTEKPTEKKSINQPLNGQSDNQPKVIESIEKYQSSATDLGFSEQDVAKDLEKSEEFKTAAPEPEFDSKDPEVLTEISSQPSSPVFPVFFTTVLQSIKRLSIKASNFFKNFKTFKNAPKTLTLVVIGFSVILISIIFAYWHIPKATVTLFVEPKTLDEDIEITIDPHLNALSLETNTLPGNSIEISVEGSKSIPTTGTALVGDAAQGDITIYNKTNQLKTFSIGTVLIGPDNLSFTLDEDTTVASRSSNEDGDGVITITPGKAEGKLTAKSIGPEGNLSDGEKLSFKQFTEDDYYAKVNGGLSGGTAREVKAVSKTDQADLLSSLSDDLKQKAELDLKNKLGADRILVDVENQEDLISKKYNYDVDEEADNLKLDAKLEYTALSYKKDDLDLLLEQTIKEKIPNNYQLSESSEIQTDPAVLNKDDTATIAVSFKAKLTPKIDFTEIKNSLKGKYPDIIKDYLASIPGFIKADIIITPNLPLKLKTLPRVTKNIYLEIKPLP